MADSFATDILTGLQQKPKVLSSKYFYDESGSELFKAIMQLPEYYLTNSEFEILSTYKNQFLELFQDQAMPFELIEFGAGDGLKTKLLLSHFTEEKADFTYCPIDISATALEELADDLAQTIPNLKVKPINGDYFSAFDQLNQDSKTRKVVLFLGSNIGNFKNQDAVDFLKALRQLLNPGDLLVMGYDLKKHPQVILNAYNDSSGITKAFNLNLLQRINERLGSDFDLSKFDHYPIYDPEKGEARSYIVSMAKQQISFKDSDLTIDFEWGEVIHTEISRKYDVEEMATVAEKSGYEPVQHFFDSKHYFTDSVWKAN